MKFTQTSSILPLFPRWFGGKIFAAIWRFAPDIVSQPSMYIAARLRADSSIHMRLNPTDTGHQRIAWLGEYESELTDRICQLAEIGGTLLDVGANYGYFTLLWCAAHPENRVFAIEASPRNLDHLRHNVNENGFADRVTILPWAASDVSGTVTFDLGPEAQTGWGGIVTNSANASISVPSHRLDQYFVNQNFAVMKVDCEGADTLVLRGSEGLLTNRALSHIFFEENLERMSQLGVDCKEAPELLEKHGYAVTRFQTSELHAQVPIH